MSRGSNRRHLIFLSLIYYFFYKAGTNARKSKAGDYHAKEPQKSIVDFHTINVKWHPEQEQRNREERHKDRRDRRWEILPLWITSGLALFAVVVSGLSLQESNRQANEAKNQTDIAALTASPKLNAIIGARIADFNGKQSIIITAVWKKISGIDPEDVVGCNAMSIDNRGEDFPVSIECKFQKMTTYDNGFIANIIEVNKEISDEIKTTKKNAVVWGVVKFKNRASRNYVTQTYCQKFIVLVSPNDGLPAFIDKSDNCRVNDSHV